MSLVFIYLTFIFSSVIISTFILKPDGQMNVSLFLGFYVKYAIYGDTVTKYLIKYQHHHVFKRNLTA